MFGRLKMPALNAFSAGIGSLTWTALAGSGNNCTSITLLIVFIVLRGYHGLYRVLQ